MKAIIQIIFLLVVCISCDEQKSFHSPEPDYVPERTEYGLLTFRSMGPEIVSIYSDGSRITIIRETNESKSIESFDSKDVLGDTIQRIYSKEITPKDVYTRHNELFLAYKMKEASLICDAVLDTFHQELNASWADVLQRCGDAKKVSGYHACKSYAFYSHYIQHVHDPMPSILKFLEKHKLECEAQFNFP